MSSNRKSKIQQLRTAHLERLGKSINRLKFYVSRILTFQSLIDRPNLFASNHREAFEAAIKRAILKDVTFHTLRHTAASHLAQAGVNLLSISKILGHSTTQMTARYAHLTPDYQAKAIMVLDRVLGVRRKENVTNTAQDELESEVTKKAIDITPSLIDA